MARRAARVDDTQKEIVKRLREVGCSVHVLSGVGDGFPDLAVGRGGTSYLLECKTGNGGLTKHQIAWHATWAGHSAIVRTPEEALNAVGIRFESVR